MTLLDVKHVQKIYKTRFQGNQVEASRIFTLPSKRVTTLHHG
ncbi:hypothetical protein U750_08750 [Streptococcus pseudopneumoniae G42]|nr:hypothetical protein U750_08750 [Streptococcus pseudopneumoniae G42]